MTIDEVKRQLFVNSDDVLGNDMVDLYEAQNCCDTSFSIGYNKAIDDFSERIKQVTYTRVVWDNNGFCTKEQGSEDIQPLDKCDQEYFEVCGNIFDNMELLEVGE